jgi:hypothetical protein
VFGKRLCTLGSGMSYKYSIIILFKLVEYNIMQIYSSFFLRCVHTHDSIILCKDGSEN